MGLVMKSTSVLVLIAVTLLPVAYGQLLADPTRPPWIAAPRAASAGARQGLRAIVLDGPKRLALIDGRWLALGARLGALRLVAIHHYAVILRGKGITRRMSLEGHSARVSKIAILRENNP